MATSAHLELELGLYQYGKEAYGVDIRLIDWSEKFEGDPPPERGLVRFDFTALLELHNNPQAYGKLLAQSLFGDPTVKQLFEQARAVAGKTNRVLRVRLSIHSSAARLHALRWETLWDETTDTWLIANQRILFSRYLYSAGWSPYLLRHKAELQALVVIASPAELAKEPRRLMQEDGDRASSRVLSAINTEAELRRAVDALGLAEEGGLIARQLVSDGTIRVTRQHLLEELQNRYDILYLVCHGALFPSPEGSVMEPYLFLEREDGQADVVPGVDLVRQIALGDPARRPVLVILASCQSAGAGDSLSEETAGLSSDDQGELAALGPRLVAAGIPAVLAMQGNVMAGTVARFMLSFIRELREDGQVDRAVAVARGMITDAPDYWAPTLFSRLRRGGIWLDWRLAEHDEFEQWPSLWRSIRNRRLLPILGPELLHPYIGSLRDLARRLAMATNFPLSPNNFEDIHQIAQFNAVTQDGDTARAMVAEYIATELLERFQDVLSPTTHHDLRNWSELTDEQQAERIMGALHEVGRFRRSQDEHEIHKVLAQLPLPVYITTNPDDMLLEALREANKEPRVEVLPWKFRLAAAASDPQQEPFRPSVETPLVYHFFGSLQDFSSLVITEDDHFDYLMRFKDSWTYNILPEVQAMLSSKPLLFLGFQMDDWRFRVLYRSILSADKGEERGGKSVAVQIAPLEEGNLSRRARDYLQRYFRYADLDTYWGTAQDFVVRLPEERKRRA